MTTQEQTFNHELSDSIEKALKSGVQQSHIIGILSAAQFKLLMQVHEGYK